MRMNHPVTQKNLAVRQDANILSTTNPKGQITHINDEFIDISGFSRDELIGEPHNIVRHPDMPRAAYEEMWQRLKAGKSWLGAVKNRCKNGDHYWVQAYAIPIFDGKDNLLEFQSIRSRLDEKAQGRAEDLYGRLRADEPDNGPLPDLKLRRDLSLSLKLYSVIAAVIVTHSVGLFWAGGLSSEERMLPHLLVTLLAIGIGLAAVGWLMTPFRNSVARSRAIIDDVLAEKIFTGRTDDVGSIELALTQQAAELDAVVKRLHDVVHHLGGLAEESIRQSDGAHHAVREQSQATDTIASASEEMSTTAGDVARHASSMLDQVHLAGDHVTKGQDLTRSTQQSMKSLVVELEQASSAISQLALTSKGVEGALGMIGDITEQTNLLALNASIEAARAGEAGRGFAVVADEVRSLALRTKNSTEQITSTLSAFAKIVSQATNTMETCVSYARKTDGNARNSAETLNELVAFIDKISDGAGSTAAASKQQHSAAAEISSRIIVINDLGENAIHTVRTAQESMVSLKSHITNVAGLVTMLRQRNLS